ncbi:hypothetical protein PENTCL1PPCAC_17199, partial [Pristionchus entomophagus]
RRLVDEHCMHGAEVRFGSPDEVFHYINHLGIPTVVEKHWVILPILNLGHFADVLRGCCFSQSYVSHDCHEWKFRSISIADILKSLKMSINLTLGHTFTYDNEPIFLVESLLFRRKCDSVSPPVDNSSTQFAHNCDISVSQNTFSFLFLREKRSCSMNPSLSN